MHDVNSPVNKPVLQSVLIYCLQVICFLFLVSFLSFVFFSLLFCLKLD